MKTTSKEGLLIVLKDGSPVAVVRRDEASTHQVFYRLEEMGAEMISELLSE